MIMVITIIKGVIVMFVLIVMIAMIIMFMVITMIMWVMMIMISVMIVMIMMIMVITRPSSCLLHRDVGSLWDTTLQKEGLKKGYFYFCTVFVQFLL